MLYMQEKDQEAQLCLQIYITQNMWEIPHACHNVKKLNIPFKFFKNNIQVQLVFISGRKSARTTVLMSKHLFFRFTLCKKKKPQLENWPTITTY